VLSPEKTGSYTVLPGQAVREYLADKPSGCVVNLEVRRDDPRIEFSYRYFGGTPGHPMALDGFSRARKAFSTRDVESGEFRKVEREHHVIVPHGKFSMSLDVIELAHALFG
jgi:hypothetical protein